MTIARRWFRDRRRRLFGWSLGVTALVWFAVGVFPTVKGNEAIDRAIEELPVGLRSLGGLIPGVLVTEAPGYLHTQVFTPLVPAMFIIFAIDLGTRAIGGDEQDRTLELLVTHPVTRTRIALERCAANAALLAVLTVVFLAGLLVSAPLVGALDGVSPVGLAGASAALFSLAFLHSSIAFIVGANTGRRAAAIGTAAGVAIAGYLILSLLAVTDAIDFLRYITPWHWYLGRIMLIEGVAPDAILAPVLIGVALQVVGTYLFTRRDLR